MSEGVFIEVRCLCLDNLSLTTTMVNDIIRLVPDETCAVITHIYLQKNRINTMPDLSRFPLLRGINLMENAFYFAPDLMSLTALESVRMKGNPYGNAKNAEHNRRVVRYAHKCVRRRRCCKAGVALLRCFKWYKQPKDIARYVVKQYILSTRKCKEWEDPDMDERSVRNTNKKKREV